MASAHADTLPIERTPRTALLLTASVAVNRGLAAVSSHDSQEREAVYADNLRYQLANHPEVGHVVFGENSGWPMTRFEDVCAASGGAKTVELLPLACNDFAPDLGKGFGESLLIDRALSASKSLADFDWIVKLTGRQRVENLGRLLDRLPHNLVFACDLRDHPLYDILHLPGAGHFCDTRTFVFTQPFFDQTFRRLYLAHRGPGEFNQEDAYYRTVKALTHPDVVRRFPIEPRFRGPAGHWQKDYGGARERAKQRLRAAVRVCFPGLHI